MVIPVHDVEPYLRPCLDSVLAQEVEGLEVVAVDDGSSDASGSILAEYAERDRRVRALGQAHAGQGAARNRAIAAARGEFLTFVDADDLVPAGAFRAMLAALRRSGSDFVVGATRRLEKGAHHRPSWNAAVHERDRIGVTIDEFPVAMLDVIACNRMFQRPFWLDRVGSFPEGTVYEDHVPMVAAYLRARRFDVLSRVTYDWRIRDDGTSTGQQKHDLANLLARVRVKADARALVEAEASPTARAAWIGRVLDTDLPPFIDHALRADAEYRDVLRDAMAEHVALATPEALSHVRVQQKVRTFLASRGAWSDLEAAQAFFREHGSIPPTTIDDGRVALVDGLSDRLGTPIPPELLELSRSESRMQACALRAEWIGPAALRLTGWAVVRGVDLADRQPMLELALVAAEGIARRELPIERVALAEATRWVAWPHGSFERAGFRTVIDLGEQAAEQAARDWRLRVRIVVDGVEREGGLHHAVAGSSASRAAIAAHAADDRTVLMPRYDAEHGLTISIRPATELRAEVEGAPALAVAAAEVAEGLIRLRASAPDASVAMSNGTTAVPGRVARDVDGSARISLPLRTADGRPLPSGDWVVRADGEEPATLDTAFAQTLPLEVVTTTHRVRCAIQGRRELRIELAAPLTDDELGPRPQQLLRMAYAADSRGLEQGGILVMPVPGATPSEMLLALAAEAGRAGLRRWWSVPDLAASVPDGADAVVIGSADWYARLAGATIIASAADLEPWFVRRPHQRLVRVFDVEPDAPVGRSAWWRAGFTPGRIAEELGRAARWNVLVVPDVDQVERYRRELDFRGPVLALDTPPARILAELAPSA